MIPIKPRVFNKRSRGHAFGDAVYVGRPTKWGNPFEIGKDGNRAEVIRKFRAWVREPAQEALCDAARVDLRGRDLLCWCAPEACHADTWLEIANA